VLAFVPASRPLDLFDPARKGRNKLYVKRVLISQDTDLLPAGCASCASSSTAPICRSTVSREHDPGERGLCPPSARGATSRIVQELAKLAESEPEKFSKSLGEFRRVLKGAFMRTPNGATFCSK